LRAYYCDHHAIPLPEGHPFPLGKYAALRQALLSQGVLAAHQLRPAQPAPLPAVLAVHGRAYVTALLEGRLDTAALRRLGFPWSRAFVRRALASAGGTLCATRAALQEGIAGNLAGGTHHAHADFGSGYCALNDLAIAARWALGSGAVERVLILDLDVHQGDGTAALFASEERVFTCSLHGTRNFPARKAASDLDVGLPDGSGDEDYLAALEEALERALERARPELVLYQGGVDPLASDRLGRLALSPEGLARRDEYALSRLRSDGLPVVLTLGGGYSDPIELSVAAHLTTWRIASQLAGRPADPGPSDNARPWRPRTASGTPSAGSSTGAEPTSRPTQRDAR